MIKFITILIGCSLTLAAGVRAEQADQENPKKKPVQKSKTVQKQQFTPKQQTVPNTHVQGVHTQPQNTTIPNNAKIHDSNVSKQQIHKVPAVQSNTLPPVQSNRLPAIQTNKLPPVQTNKLPAVQTNKLPPVQTNKLSPVQSNTLPPVQTNKLPAVQTNKLSPVQTNKLPAVQTNKLPAVQTNKQTVQSFHPAHVNFHAQPSSAIAGVRFNQHYRINGSENWQGTHYQVFQSYHPQWHDHGWWHSHHNHIVLIGGGWYFWNAGYWYPAWGYDTAAAYYPYDGPIYVGANPTPLDQVIADVQSSLQEQGYYHGEVDGLLGPLTREALTNYQRDHGLYETAAIDQPTLESLGMG